MPAPSKRPGAAPGEVDLAMGEHNEDVKKWIFTHDASTLWANPGSCVVDLGAEGTPVIGIHFGGGTRPENFAHAAAAAAVQNELSKQGGVFV